MKKICLIVVLILAMVDASAQWKWKENSSFGWKKSESQWKKNESSWRKSEGQWKSEHSWWNGFYGESTTFHKGKKMYDTHYTDRSAGTTYGFVGGRDSQVQRDYSRRNSYSAATGQWNGINAASKNVARRNNVVWTEARSAERTVTRSNGGNLLNRKVWSEKHHGRTIFYGGGVDATDYGRRVKPKGAPGNYNTPNAVGMKIGSKIKEMPVVGSNDESGRRSLGQDDEGVAGGQYGFGEVPKDDAPVGDGALILLLFAALFGIYKIYHQDFD